MSFRAGTVALVGRPNAGKSSLLNALVGERIAAVSRRPQTTRVRQIGVWQDAEMQAVLVDTPGLHEAWTEMNRRLVAAARKGFEEVDVILWIVDSMPLCRIEAPALDDDTIAIRDELVATGKPLVLALTKVDEVEKGRLLPVMALLADAAEVVPISARRRDGLDTLAKVVRARLPEGPPLYPPDHLTDATERAIVAEIIRERVFERCDQEVPYATAVEIEKFDESARAQGKVRVYAKILVEKDSQKAILIGKGGQMVKRIGIEARMRIETFLGCAVRLDLFVVVEKDWTKNPRMLKDLGME